MNKIKIVSTVLQYLATTFSLLGGAMLTIPHWSMFVFWTLASILWIAFGFIEKHYGLVTSQAFFFIINIVSLYRIFGGLWHGY